MPISADVRFNMILVTHDAVNAVLLWDLTTGNSLKFNFTQELNAVKKSNIKTVSVWVFQVVPFQGLYACTEVENIVWYR